MLAGHVLEAFLNGDFKALFEALQRRFSWLCWPGRCAQCVGEISTTCSDPSTDPFHSQWTFQNGGTYKANFVRDGNAIAAVAVLEAAGSGSSASNPTDKRKPNPPDANKKQP